MNANNYVKQKIKGLFTFRFFLGVMLFISILQCALSLFDSQYSVICFAVPLLYIYTKYTNKQMLDYLDNIRWHLAGGVAMLALQLFTNSLEFTFLQISYLLLYSFLTYRNTFSAARDNMHKITVSVVVVYSYFIVSFALVKILEICTDYMQYTPAIEFAFVTFCLSLLAVIFVFLAVIGVNLDQYYTKVSSEKNDAANQSIPNPARKAFVLSSSASGIIEFFESNQAVLNPNFSIEDLAYSVNLSKSEVSEVINQELAINFYQLVAKYRIDHAKTLLQTKDKLTIEAIVEESGFNSKSTFNKYFKLFVGQTPSDYRNDYITL
ncbi:helix-turn-helix domain-containing protein [Myroides sp. LJL119]